MTLCQVVFFVKGYAGGKSNHIHIYIYYNMIEKERKRKEGRNVRVIDNFFFFGKKDKTEQTGMHAHKECI